MRLPALTLLLVATPWASWCASPNVEQIIKNSVAANARDFKAGSDYNNKERDRTPEGSKTYQSYMIEGSPYEELIALNDQPLSAAQKAEEQRKLQQVRQKRRSESASDRQQRIAKYEKERTRDNAMIQQLTEAFEFKLLGQHKLRGFTVYVLKATPKPGYRPPNMETQVLTGMQGELWIDTKTFQWVRVTAQVIHPVSIEGFLARVEPGTRFELEKAPIGDGNIWQPSHFSMRSNARILGVFNKNSQEDDTYWDYQRAAK